MLWQHKAKHADKLEENYQHASVSIGERLGPFSGLGWAVGKSHCSGLCTVCKIWEETFSPSFYPINTDSNERMIRNQEDSHAAEYLIAWFFIPPEFSYYLHSTQLCQPAVQGLWLTLGHKPQAEKGTEGGACLEVTLCGDVIVLGGSRCS